MATPTDTDTDAKLAAPPLATPPGLAAAPIPAAPAATSHRATTAGKLARATSILPVEGGNFFLNIGIVLTLACIVCPWWVTAALVALLWGWLWLLWRHLRKGVPLPEPLALAAAGIGDRLRQAPLEWAVPIGAVVITVVRAVFGRSHPWVAELVTTLFLLLTFGICHQTRLAVPYRPGGRSLVRALTGQAGGGSRPPAGAPPPTPSPVVPLPPALNTPPPRPAPPADSASAQWEEKRRQRWEDWLQEETRRLEDNRQSASYKRRT